MIRLFVSCLITAILSFTAFPLFAQSPVASQPEEPEILLPTALLEVESIPFEQVDAVLPGASQIVLPEMDVTLPAVGELALQPRLLIPGDSVEEGQSASESSLFSTASIYAGSHNLVEGRLGVFKLGQFPRFRFSFTHFGLDGYADHPAGTGFFRSEQLLDGWFGTQVGTTQLETDVVFREWQEGMQRQSDPYYSLVMRFFSSDTRLEFRPDELIGLYAQLVASTAARRFALAEDSVSVPPADTELHIRPSLRAALELQSFMLGIDLGYTYHNITMGDGGDVPLSQLFSVDVNMTARPTSTIDIAANAGAVRLFSRPRSLRQLWLVRLPHPRRQRCRVRTFPC